MVVTFLSYSSRFYCSIFVLIHTKNFTTEPWFSFGCWWGIMVLSNGRYVVLSYSTAQWLPAICTHHAHKKKSHIKPSSHRPEVGTTARMNTMDIS